MKVMVKAAAVQVAALEVVAARIALAMDLIWLTCVMWLTTTS